LPDRLEVHLRSCKKAPPGASPAKTGGKVGGGERADLQHAGVDLVEMVLVLAEEEALRREKGQEVAQL